MPQTRHYTSRDLASVLGCSDRFVRMRLAKWAPERERGSWHRLTPLQAAHALAYCLAQPRRQREGRVERPRELRVALGLLAAMAEAQAEAASTCGGGEC